MNLCGYESEEHEYGTGDGMNTKLMSDAQSSTGLVESVSSANVFDSLLFYVQTPRS